MATKMEIVFRPNHVDTEEVRETLEDNMGVQILEINEEYPAHHFKKLKKVV
jgi:hypothetical protein